MELVCLFGAGLGRVRGGLGGQVAASWRAARRLQLAQPGAAEAWPVPADARAPLPHLPPPAAENVQLVMLGSGREDLENALREMESRHHDKCRGWVGFSVKMAHRITAGAPRWQLLCCGLCCVPSCWFLICCCASTA